MFFTFNVSGMSMTLPKSLLCVLNLTDYLQKLVLVALEEQTIMKQKTNWRYSTGHSSILLQLQLQCCCTIMCYISVIQVKSVAFTC